MEEDLPTGVAEDPKGGAEGFGGRMGAEAAVGDLGESGGERVKLKVVEADLGRVGGLGGEGGEDLGAGVDAAGGAELGEVLGEQELEGFGILTDGRGKELALEGFEVGGEGRIGRGGDGDSLLPGEKLWPPRRDLGTRTNGFRDHGGYPRG